MSEMVERAVKTLRDIDLTVGTPNYYQVVRAIIESMREPSDQMLCSGGEILLEACSSEKGNLHPWKPFDVAQTARKTFCAMIDEALK